MAGTALDVLYEDNHLLVVNKPVNLPTMGVGEDRPSLLTVAKAYIKKKYDKPGNVYLGVVSRLDAPVSGALVIARTSKAAARLTEAFREGNVEKIYWALTQQPPEPMSGEMVDWMRKDERHRKMHVTHQQHAEAKLARLRYRTLKTDEDTTLIEVQLDTGRKHQIRVQFARRGLPILGDRKYGSPVRFADGIALHSRRVRFEHPVKKTMLEFVAPLPGAWQSICQGLS